VRKLELAQGQVHTLTAEKGQLVREYERRLASATSSLHEAMARAEVADTRSLALESDHDRSAQELRHVKAQLQLTHNKLENAQTALQTESRAAKTELERTQAACTCSPCQSDCTANSQTRIIGTTLKAWNGAYKASVEAVGNASERVWTSMSVTSTNFAKSAVPQIHKVHGAVRDAASRFLQEVKSDEEFHFQPVG
jgi:hypothetical protein